MSIEFKQENNDVAVFQVSGVLKKMNLMARNVKSKK